MYNTFCRCLIPIVDNNPNSCNLTNKEIDLLFISYNTSNQVKKFVVLENSRKFEKILNNIFRNIHHVIDMITILQIV